MSIQGNEVLPKNWAICDILEISNFIRGISFPKDAKLAARSADSIACLRTKNIQREVEWEDLWWVSKSYVRHAQQIVLPRDVLISVSNSVELVGKVAQVGELVEPSTIGAFIGILRSLTPISARYFFYALANPDTQNTLRSLASTTTNIANVNSTKLAGLQIALAPGAEQTRIADTLDELLSDLDAGVAALERVRAKLKLYRASVLKAAVEGALTADWRAQHPDVEPASELLQRILAERRRRWEEDQLRKFKEKGKVPPKDWKTKYKQPIAPDTSGLPELPEGWCWVSLDQLSEFITSGSRGWKEFYSADGAMFVRSQDIRTDRLELDNVAFVSLPPDSEGTRTRLKQGDMLVTITGANVAKAALVDVEIQEAYVSQHVGLVRLVLDKIGSWVHTYTVAPSGGRKVLLIAAYGAGKPGLNLDNLRELAIPFPSQLEQEAIVDLVDDQLSIIDHLEADLDAKFQSAQALRQSILRHAFSGKLVPQDPNDEPASELLKRIAAERAAATGKKNGKAKANSDPSAPPAKRGRKPGKTMRATP